MKSRGKDDFFWPKFVEVYQQSFSVLIKDPTIWIPFIFIGVLDFVALALLFLAPSPPVSYVVAPIIRTFWSSRFLHYPENFLLLPKLQAHAHFLIATIFGVFVTGMAIKKIEAALKGDARLSTSTAIREVFGRYISLVVVWLFAYFLFKILFNFLNPILTMSLWVQLGAGYVVAVIVQALLGFIIPSVMLREGGFFKSVWEGVVFGFKNLGIASALMVAPLLAVTAVSFAKGLSPILVNYYEPDSVLWILVVGIILTVIADILVTSVTAVLYLNKGRILNHENA